MATAKKRQPAGAESAAALAKPAKLATETTASVKPTKLVAETKLAAAAAVATTTTTAHALLTRTISPPATTLSAVALASTIMTPDNGPEALALHAEVQGAHAADLASAVLSPPLDIRADDKENVRRGQGAGRRYNAKRRLSEDDCSYSDSGLVGIVQRQSDNAPLLVSPSKLGKHVTSPYNKVRVIGPQQLTSSTPVVPAASSGAAVRSCGPAHTMLPANGNAAVHTANATANAAFTIGKLDAVAPTTRRAIAKASSVKKAAAKAPATAPVERTRRLSFTGGRCVKQVAGRQSPTPTITNTATICNTAEKDKESTSTSASASVSDDDQSPAMSPHLKRLVRNDGNDEDRPRDSPLTVLVDDDNSVNDDRRAALAAPAIDHCTVAINRETTFSLNSDDEDDDEAESADTSPSPEDPLLIGNEDSLDQTQWPDVGAVNGLNLGSTTTAGMAPTAVHDGGASFLSPIGIHRPAPVQRPLRSTRVTTSANPLVSPRGQQLCCEESLASPVMTFGAQHRQNHQPFLSRPQDETLSACPSFGSASSFSFDAGHLLGGADQLHSSPITTSFGGLPPQGCQQPVAQYGFQNAGTAAPFFGRYSAQYQQQYQFGPDGQDDDAYDAENEELEGAAAYAHYFVVRDSISNPGKSWLEFHCNLQNLNERGDDGFVTPFDLHALVQSTATSTLSSPAVKKADCKEDLQRQEELALLRDKWNAWAVAEEKHYMAHGGYFMYQPFTASARAILVNWLMETASEHGQLRQTLQVAVNLLDRFFSLTTQVPTDLIQPIATAALHIASKIEEAEALTTQQVQDLISGTVSSAQLTAIEVKMMKVLNWKLTPPTYCDWLGLYMRNAQLDDPTLFGNVYDDYAKHIDGVQSGMGVIDVVEELDVEKDFKSIDTALYTRIISLIDLVMHHSASLDYKASTTVAAALYVFCRRELRFDSDPKENERICIDFIFKYTYHSVDDIENCIELVEDVYDQKYVHEDMPAFSGLVSDAAIRRLDPPAPNSAQQSHARQFTKSQRPATRSSTNSAGGGAAGKMQPGCVDFANNSRMVEHKARFYFQTQYCDLPNYLQRGAPGAL